MIEPSFVPGNIRWRNFYTFCIPKNMYVALWFCINILEPTALIPYVASSGAVCCTVCPKFRYSLPSKSSIPHESVFQCWDVHCHWTRTASVDSYIIPACCVTNHLTECRYHKYFCTFRWIVDEFCASETYSCRNPGIIAWISSGGDVCNEAFTLQYHSPILCECACVECVMSNIRADAWCHSYTRYPEISGFRATLRGQIHSFHTAKFAVLCCRVYISTCSELVLCTYVLLLDNTGSNFLYCVE